MQGILAKTGWPTDIPERYYLRRLPNGHQRACRSDENGIMVTTSARKTGEGVITEDLHSSQGMDNRLLIEVLHKIFDNFLYQKSFDAGQISFRVIPYAGK